MKTEMTKVASFSLVNYKVKKFSFEASDLDSDAFDVKFEPSGIFYNDKTGSNFKLDLKFSAFDIEGSQRIETITIEFIAYFKFSEKINFKEIPDFFYKNSIAIIFPYLRAFVSTLSLQANLPLMLLPTLNLTTLAKPFQENTKEEIIDNQL